MKVSSTLIIALIATLASFSHAQSISDFKNFSSYALHAQDAEKNMHPVVGIEDGFPLIITDSGVIKARGRYVRAKPRSYVNNQSVEIFTITEDRNDTRMILDVFLKSSEGIQGGYAIIAYTTEGKNWESCKIAGVPVLTGQPQNIKLRFNTKDVPEKGWKLYFFSRGLAIYDVDDATTKPATNDQIFNLQFARYKIVVGTGDANPAPLFMAVPSPDASLLPKGDDAVMVKVKINIAADGRIDEVDFPEAIEPGLKAHLSSAIETWRFLPRIKKGQAVSQKTLVPLKLR